MKKLLLYLIGLLLVIVIFWQADFYQVWESVKNIHPTLLVIACLLQVLTILMINFQWHSLSRQIGEGIAFKKIFHMNMVGTFVESITPSVKAGGEATKVVLLKREMDLSTGKATALVMLQKIISITIFLLLNIVAIAYFFFAMLDRRQDTTIIFWSFLLLVCVLVSIIVLILHPQWLWRIVDRLPILSKTKEKLKVVGNNCKATIRGFLKNRKHLYQQIILSIFIWGFFAVKAYFLARSLNINISFASMAVVTYLTYMVGMVPLLPGGIGTFEGSMIFLLIPMGVEASSGMALALALRFVTFWFVFIFSCIYLGCNYLKNMVSKMALLS